MLKPCNGIFCSHKKWCCSISFQHEKMSLILKYIQNISIYIYVHKPQEYFLKLYFRISKIVISIWRKNTQIFSTYICNCSEHFHLERYRKYWKGGNQWARTRRCSKSFHILKFHIIIKEIITPGSFFIIYEKLARDLFFL